MFFLNIKGLAFSVKRVYTYIYVKASVVDEKILVGWFIEKPTRLVKTQKGAGKFEPTRKREYAESSVRKEEILVGASKSE